MRLILASGSKQRQDIFKMVGFKYEVIKSTVEENSNATDPNEYVMELSKTKADSVAEQINSEALIVAADTIIYMNGKIYEKPKSKEEAFQSIKEMSGNVSYAITGVTIKDLYNDKEVSFCDVADIYMRKAEDEEIKWYIDNEEDLLNISGYAMLGKASIFLEKVDGDYNTLFGISPSKLVDKFKELGYKITDFELD
ncbi:MAG: septum formation protein Maf [Clostridia bacterium]|nr:septum formation protein Maf [Clostridia bacterium]